ncbi:ABC transporter permease [Actinophytocola xinjiangensis]|uniref:ABC transporter permease n=1 Tax=Actinophytocola xinjiangensis TaxID=485602 RepID=A0A7Z0WS83_9PSEU|nr:ABC transporter permease [Actinophytocola xinjiangensis]OLF14388.1 ABC transporter permease [Actinophytocola xinjiangensis]
MSAIVPVVEPRARLVDLVAAEWIKLRSLRSTWIAYGITAVVVVGLNAAIAVDTSSHWKPDPVEDARFVRDGIPLLEAFTSNSALIMMLALGTLGALMIIGEYGTGTIRSTLAAVPARRSVMTAKAAVLTVVTTVFGTLVATASFLLTQAILHSRNLGVSITHPGAARVVVASALLAPVCALVGLALGAVIRRTAATLTASAGVLVLLPLLLTEGSRWSAVAAHATPFHAWSRIVTPRPHPTPYPWTTGGAWTVLAAWALVAAAVTIVSLHRRDQ